MLDRKTAVKDAVVRQKIPLNDRLIVALDIPSVDEARKVVAELGDDVTFYKIGMQLQFAGGLDFAKELIATGKKVFLDSKLWDIDQTITNAVANVAKMGVTFLTVHGMSKTIQAAVKGRGTSPLQILVVTVLTHLDRHDLKDLGYACSIEELVKFRVKMALEAGADGVIASGLEASDIKEVARDRLKIIMPGIRPNGSESDDQKRVVSPADAIEAGADYLVVGRPILRAPDRRQAAREIIDEISQALNKVARQAA